MNIDTKKIPRLSGLYDTGRYLEHLTLECIVRHRTDSVLGWKLLQV